MSEAKFKTMRHIETVRNFLGVFVKELVTRAEVHDQSKLQSPEVEILEVMTPQLRGLTYGSDEYRAVLKQMKPMTDHHYACNRHHVEWHRDPACHGVLGMNLLDILEMLADWKAAGLRHHDGDIFKSIEINQKRYGFSDELASILVNTAKWMNEQPVTHHAEES